MFGNYQSEQCNIIQTHGIFMVEIKAFSSKHGNNLSITPIQRHFRNV